MPDPKKDMGSSAKKWSSLFFHDREVEDVPSIEDCRFTGHTKSLVEVFLGDDQFFRAEKLARSIGRPQAVAWLDDRSMADLENKTTEVSEHKHVLQSRRVYTPITPTELVLDLKARPFHSTQLEEADRRLVYISDLSTDGFSALAQTATTTGTAPLRFVLELHLPYLTLSRSRGEYKPTDAKWERLSWLNPSPDEQAEAGLDNDREKLGPRKGALEFLKTSTSHIDQTEKVAQSAQISTTVPGYHDIRWTAYVFTDSGFGDGSENVDPNALDPGQLGMKEHRKVTLHRSVSDVPTQIEFRRSMNKDELSKTHQTGILLRYIGSPSTALSILHQHVQRKRHLKLAYTIFLTGAQLACIVPIQGYNIDHGESSTSPRSSMAGDLGLHFLDHLHLNFGVVTHPSTTLFVFAVLAYGAVGMHQYSVNGSDHFNQIFLIVGIVVGFWLSLPPLEELGVQRVVSSNLALAVTGALFISAVGHWVYAICFTKGEREEERDVIGDSKVEGEMV